VSERELKHVLADEPDKFEQRVGVRYCRRCGRPIETTSGAPMSGALKPCERVTIELRRHVEPDADLVYGLAALLRVVTECEDEVAEQVARCVVDWWPS
jgi:hypothetical protein